MHLLSLQHALAVLALRTDIQLKNLVEYHGYQDIVAGQTAAAQPGREATAAGYVAADVVDEAVARPAAPAR